MARAPRRERQSFRAAALFPDCSKADGSSLRRVFSEFARRIRNRAHPPRTPAFRWLPPCPCRRPPGEDRAGFPSMLVQFSSATIPVARGSRSAATRERRRSGTANGRAPAARFFHLIFREPAQPLLPVGRAL